MLRINVTTAEAVITETELITSGRKGLRCAFTFSDDWAGLAKTVIVQGAATRDIALLATNEITVPAECVNKAQFPLKIGVYGARPDGSIAIPTIWASFGKVLPGAKPSDIPPDELTPDVVAQIQEAANNALYLARNVQSMADSGALDGVSPAVTVTSITGGHNVKITDRDHPDGQDFDVPDGQDGEDGEDGVSPLLSSTAITGGHRVSMTDRDGTTTFDVMDGVDGTDGTDGTDGVSPTISSESITGGHRLTIVDAGGTTTVDVMDGQDGQDGADAVVDPTLSVAGEAADAKATGDELYRHRLELTALSPEIGADAYAWNLRKNYNGSGSYVTADGFGITSNYIPVQHGSRVQNTAPERDGNGKYTAMHINEFAGTTWLRRTILASGKYMSIGADTTSIRIAYGYASNQGVTITQELIDATFSVRIIQQPSSGGGGGITVDDALSGSSTNPVQNKVVKAALDGKYAKPGTGVPKTDLAAAVQTSLGRADTALQQHQDISGKLDRAQGVAHAGEFCVVGSDGNITTVSMTAWQGGSY